MFLAAANELNLPPKQILFIGDRIDNDIIGSLGAGMIPVFKKTPINKNKKIPAGVEIVDNLSELPELIEKINITV